MSNLYLDRYAFSTQYISDPPASNLHLIITIPCYNELHLLRTLKSLETCDRPSCAVEIIVLINESENDSAEIREQNIATETEAVQWANQHNCIGFKTHIIYANDLPHKHAGVGLARKMVMDEAVRRFESIEHKDGIIGCLDADAVCDSNYLVELYNHFNQHPKSPGCSIYFEHPLDEENPKNIILYELFLRYYVNGLRYAGFPYSFQTVGSSMAVRSWAYQKQGGMNRKKAGEDFYFLHRIIPLGNYTELNKTRVIPSPRDSDRVPFGTGQSMIDAKNGKKTLQQVYNPKIFEDLKIFLSQIDSLLLKDKIGELPDSIKQFLNQMGFPREILRLRKQSSTPEIFRKHFFQWFDGFMVLKFVHFSRDFFHQQVELNSALNWLSDIIDVKDLEENSEKALLALRRHDRQNQLD